MKRNTKIHIIQVLLASFAMIQLMESAFFMALISVIMIYCIGAFEDSGYDYSKE